MCEGGAFYMKKAIKKAALGLTLALTMTTAIACTPGDDAANENNVRGVGFDQYENNENRNRGQNAGQNGGNLFGNQNGGQNGGDLFGNRNGNNLGNANRADVDRLDADLNDARDTPGLFGGTAIHRNDTLGGGTNINNYRAPVGDAERYHLGAGRHGMVDPENNFNVREPALNRGTVNLGDNNDRGIRGGGFIFGGDGPRMKTARTDLGGSGYRNGVGLGAGAYNADRVDDIQGRVMNINGVRDAKVITHDNAIIVGVQANGKNQDQIVRQIRQQLQADARGEQIHVTTDPTLYNRIGDLDTRLRDNNGQAFGNAARDIGRLMNDLGRNVTAPLGNNR